MEHAKGEAGQDVQSDCQTGLSTQSLSNRQAKAPAVTGCVSASSHLRRKLVAIADEGYKRAGA